MLGQETLDRLVSLDLGDLIGVDGTVFRSRRGELSLRVDGWTLLAKSLRPPPEKHHGVQDTETRYRHRELDLLSSEETRGVFIARARIVSAVRRFLDEHGYVEVETPVLQPLYGGAAARPFTTHHNALDRNLYLRIATELYLKRLIVGGLERVYELGKDFRNEGISHKHNPEFTMVEFYEAYADYQDMAERTERIVAAAAEAAGYDGPIDLSPPWRRETLRGAILDRSGIDILEHPTRDELAAAMAAKGMRVPPDDTWAQLVDELVTKHVEPTLIEPTFLFDYPVELSPFAKRHRDDERPRRALRGVRERDGDRERLHGAERPRRPAPPLRAAARRRRGRRRGGAAVRRGVPAGARAGHAADRRRRHRDRPPRDAADGPQIDPRDRALPGNAGLDAMCGRGHQKFAPYRTSGLLVD